MGFNSGFKGLKRETEESYCCCHLSLTLFSHRLGCLFTRGYQSMPLSVPESRRAPSWRDPSSCGASRNLGSPLRDSDCESPELRWIPPQCMGWPVHGISCGTASHRCGDNSGTRGTTVSLKTNISTRIIQVCGLVLRLTYTWTCFVCMLENQELSITTFFNINP